MILSRLTDFFKMPDGFTRKQKLLRGLIGIPIGISISFIISVIISCYVNITEGAGVYYPCALELVEEMGSELNAVVLQLILSAALGFVMGAATIFWNIENWSIVRRSGVFFIITAIAMLSISYLLYWMEHTVEGFFSSLFTFAIYFAVIWLIIWLIEYVSAKRKVKKFNMQISDKKKK